VSKVEDAKAKLKLSARAGNAEYTCSRVLTSSRFALILFVTVSIWEFGVLFLMARRRLFWYDELVTFHVSNLHPFSILWRALQAGVDSTPPGYNLLVQLARKLPGDPHVTLRLPSILGYILSLLGVYLFSRKKLPAFAGLTAVLLITLSPFREYALEARPYSLLVGFLAMSAVLWQRIDETWFMTPLLALFLILAVSSHYLAVVALSSFGIAELAWTLLSRRIRWGVWAACLLASSPFFVCLPVLLHFRDIFGENIWARPSWILVRNTYGSYLGLDSKLVSVLILFFGLVVGDSLLRMVRPPRKRPCECGFSAPEIILVSGFVFYPALLVVLTKLLGSSYTSRYGWPAILGLVLGSVYLLRTLWLRSSSAYLLVALLIAFGLQGGHDFWMLYKAGSTRVRVDERWTRLAELSRSEPGIPVVIGSGIGYLEAAEYAPLELRDRLVQVVDPDVATRLVGSDTTDKTNRLLAEFIPLRVEDLSRFQAAHQKFILYSGGAYDWFTQYLVDSRYNMRLIGVVVVDLGGEELQHSKDDGGSVYIAER